MAEIETILRFRSGDHITVNGHDVFTFGAIDGFDPRSLVRGQQVSIDGGLFRVRGIETFALIDATGTSFGIMVENEPESHG